MQISEVFIQLNENPCNVVKTMLKQSGHLEAGTVKTLHVLLIRYKYIVIQLVIAHFSFST